MELTFNEIRDIVDENKGSGFTAEIFISGLTSFVKRMKVLEDDDSEITLSSMFVSNKRKRDRLERSYEKAYGSVIESLGKYSKALEDMKPMNMEHRESTLTKIRNANSTQKESDLSHLKNLNNTQKDNALYQIKNIDTVLQRSGISVKERGVTEHRSDTLNVHVVSMDNTLLGKLSASGVPVSTPKEKSTTASASGGGFGLLKALLSLAGIALGITALIKGFQTDGRLKGTLKIISKLFLKKFDDIVYFLTHGIIRVGSKIVGKTIDLMGKTFGKLGDSFLENGNKVVGKVFKNLNVGSIKGLIKSGLKKVLGKKLAPIIKLVGSGAKTVGKSAFKKIPFGIGTIISFFFAYSRFKSGDVLGGFLEIASGIAGAVPAIGTAISVGIDMLLAFRDFKSSKEERKDGKIGGVDIMGSFKKAINKIPFVKSLSGYFMGVKYFFTGRVDEGIKMMKDSGMLRVIPFMSLIVGVYEMFVLGEGETARETLLSPLNFFGETLSKITGGIIDSFVWFMDKISDMIGGDLIKKTKDFANHVGNKTKDVVGNYFKFINPSATASTNELARHANEIESHKRNRRDALHEAFNKKSKSDEAGVKESIDRLTNIAEKQLQVSMEADKHNVDGLGGVIGATSLSSGNTKGGGNTIVNVSDGNNYSDTYKIQEDRDRFSSRNGY